MPYKEFDVFASKLFKQRASFAYHFLPNCVYIVVTSFGERDVTPKEKNDDRIESSKRDLLLP